MLKFKIYSNKTAKIRKAISLLEKKIAQHSNAGVIVNHEELMKNEWEISMSYNFENRIANKLIEHELKKAIKEIDKHGVVTRIKDINNLVI